MLFKHSNSNTFYTGFLLFLHIQSVSSMDLLRAGQTVKQTNSLTSPVQTLCQIFGMGELERQELKDVRFMIAREIIGEGGWWYKRATWLDYGPHDQLALSPDGTRFATATLDNDPQFPAHSSENINQTEVHVWDLDGTELKKLSHATTVEKVFFLNDNKIVTACQSDNDSWHIFEWHIDQDEPVARQLTYALTQDRVFNDIAICQNKIKLLTKSSSGAYYIHCLETGEEQLLKSKMSVCHDFFCSEQEPIVLNGFNHQKVFQAHGAFIKKLKLDEGVFCACIAIKNNQVLGGYNNGQAVLWDLKSDEKTVFRHDESNCSVPSVAFHPRKNIVATGGVDGNLKLWSVNGHRLLTLQHKNHVESIQFNPRGTTIVAGSMDKDGGTIWQEFEKPTLDQVLLKLLLLRYVNTGIKNWKNFDLCNNPESMVEWITRSFNVQEECIKNAWNGFPVRMQEALIRTLLYKSGCTY